MNMGISCTYIYIYHIHIHIYIIHSSSHSQYPIARKHYGHVAIMNWGQYRLSHFYWGFTMTAFEAADQTNYGFGYDQGCYPVIEEFAI